MSESDQPAKSGSVVKPLVSHDNDPVFQEAWHAQTLALAATLVDSGHFTAPEWTQALADALAAPKVQFAADEPGTYYNAALSALEHLLHNKNQLPVADVDNRTEAWRQAYLHTPHGSPVELGAGHKVAG